MMGSVTVQVYFADFITLRIPLKEEIGGERRPKDRVKTG